MKKFMTVLLVVAVMFTFSFGSAFAATTSASDFNAYVNLAEQQLLNEGAAAYDSAEKLLTKSTVDGVVIEAAAWKVALAEHEADFIAAVKKATNEIKNAYAADNAGYTVAGIYGYYSDADVVTAPVAVLTSAQLVSAIAESGEYLNAAAAAQFPVTKEAELAKLDTVDTTLYSAEVKTGKTESYRAIVEKYIADQKDAIEAVVLDTTPTYGEVVTALGEIAEALEGIEEIRDEENELTGIWKLTDSQKDALEVVTLETEEEAAVSLDAYKAVAKSYIASASATVYSDALADDLTKDQMADFNADRAAFVEVCNFLVDAAKTRDAVDAVTNVLPTTHEGVDGYADRIELYEELEVYAAKYAAETKDGVLVRDAEKVADVLEEAKVAIYGGETSLVGYKAEIKDECYVNELVDEFEREVLKAEVEAARKEALKNYYEMEQADVNAAYDAVIAAIDAATTDAELEKVNTTAKVDKIDTKRQVNDKIRTTVGTEYEKLVQYYNYSLTGLTEAEVEAKEANYAARMERSGNEVITVADWILWYGEQGARSAAEVKALYAEATAVIDGLATKAELDTQKAAVEAEIAALPETVTVADAEAVKAAKEAADAYKAEGRNDIANENTLNLAVKALTDAQLKEIQAAVKALPVVAKVTVADKEAVKAAEALIEAYNEANDEDEIFEEMYADYNDAAATKSVAALVAEIQELEAKAIEAAVNALPLNITVADKAAVEAARAAYDAYVAEYSDAKTNDDAREDFAAEVAATIEAAEDTLEELGAFDAVDAQAYVQDLKIVARSVKTAKGNVKVTINADVEKLTEAGYIVEYKFYRSEKARAKYGTAKKVSEENVYTNTAGKKGVQYFYKAKLVVKNAEGEVVATTPLSQCKYATRVWSK